MSPDTIKIIELVRKSILCHPNIESLMCPSQSQSCSAVHAMPSPPSGEYIYRFENRQEFGGERRKIYACCSRTFEYLKRSEVLDFLKWDYLVETWTRLRAITNNQYCAQTMSYRQRTKFETRATGLIVNILLDFVVRKLIPRFPEIVNNWCECHKCKIFFTQSSYYFPVSSFHFRVSPCSGIGGGGGGLATKWPLMASECDICTNYEISLFSYRKLSISLALYLRYK